MRKHQTCILILDFGSQYTALLARRIREMQVYCEIVPADIATEEIEAFAPQGIILSGSPETVTIDSTLRAPLAIFSLGCPILGICYGMQTMALQLGGKVDTAHQGEFGYAKVQINQQSELFKNIFDHRDLTGNAYLDVWMSHGDQVTQLPPGFESIGSTSSSLFAGMADIKRQFYALQFHPEVTHTRQGKRILEQFVFEICQCKKNWVPSLILTELIQEIRTKVGKEKVIIGLSGGVDSAVLAVLLNKAIGEQLICLMVDTGLLRLKESETVIQVFKEHFNINVICINSKKSFMSSLKSIEDPEIKRKKIGEQFIRVFEEEAKRFSNIQWLAQGTIYPDVIESAKTKTGKGHLIKSHHNVAGLPEHMHLKLLEPLRELFKDEVRQLGLALGLPYELVNRHPFPGPGLGVRILGEINEEAISILQKADHIFIEMLNQYHLYHEVNQAFAVFLPVKSVGVKGDARHYGYVIALRAVKTIDFMTAEWAPLPHDFLAEVSNRIVNEISEISRVVYDISGKPPATIEWE